MTDDGDKNVSLDLGNKCVLIGLGFFLLILGFVLGMTYYKTTSTHYSYDRVKYVESLMADHGGMYADNRFSDQTTLGEAKNLYYRYHAHARPMLKLVLDNICGIQSEYSPPTNQSYLELCHVMCGGIQ